ncbi:MAG: hypothetical protein NTV87_13950 [Ignavibacteriae bacterium]|jgi:hypothetical protein|nr:hypothetical protein [Ignavibacteriota bacterium]
MISASVNIPNQKKPILIEASSMKELILKLKEIDIKKNFIYDKYFGCMDIEDGEELTQIINEEFSNIEGSW